MPAKFSYPPLRLPKLLVPDDWYVPADEEKILRAAAAVLTHERREPEPSAATEATYRKVLRRHEGEFAFDCDDIATILQAESPTVAAQLRSAIRRESFEFISELLEPTGDTVVTRDDLEFLTYHIQRYASFQRVRSGDDYAALDSLGSKRFAGYVSKSKRDELPRERDWREQVLAVASSARGTQDEPCDGQWGPSRYLDGVAIAWLTGARPAEIQKGVWVSYSAPEIRLFVRGVKGRVNREICWRADANSATQHLYKRLCDSDLKPTRLSVPSAGGLTHAIAGYGGVVYPSRRPARRRKADDFAKRDPSISTMSFRHQLVSDMRRAGESELRIAALLGERQARSTFHYGRSWRGTLSGGLPVSVSADSLATGARAELWRDRRLELAADDDFDPEIR